MELLPEQSNELAPQERLNASVMQALPVLRFLHDSTKAVEYYSPLDDDGKDLRAEVRLFYMSHGEESYTGFFQIDGIDKDGNRIAGRLSYVPAEHGATARFSLLGQEETLDAHLLFAADILDGLQTGYEQSQAAQQSEAEARATEARQAEVTAEASPRFPILHRALGWLGVARST